MTAQITETLIYKGETLFLCDEPLSCYFDISGKTQPFKAPHTALWRGYIGSWEIVDDCLYLTGLEGWISNGKRVDLSHLFPDHPKRVFARWVTGDFRATCGNILKYVHAGYASVYEQDVFFGFKNGRLISVNIKNNDSPEADDA